MAGAFEGFNYHMNNNPERLEWIANSKEDYYILQRDLILGPPQATEKYTTEELSKMGLNGFYRLKPE
jgi:hypothetical protein